LFYSTPLAARGAHLAEPTLPFVGAAFGFAAKQALL